MQLCASHVCRARDSFIGKKLPFAEPLAPLPAKPWLARAIVHKFTIMKLYTKLLPAMVLSLANLPVSIHTTPLPAWQLREARDSFVVNVQGKPMGFTVLAVDKMPDGGFRVTENTQIAQFVEQKTEVLLDRDHRILQVIQSGKMRGQDARIAIEYHGTHVKGAATVPGAQGPQSFVIDTEVPASVIDDNLLQSVFGALPWSSDANWTMPVFSAGKNRVTQHSLVVTGVEQLAISGGAVEAYRAELRDGESVVALWVSTAKPHRVLKTAPVGAPFEMVRAN